MNTSLSQHHVYSDGDIISINMYSYVLIIMQTMRIFTNACVKTKQKHLKTISYCTCMQSIEAQLACTKLSTFCNIKLC